VQRRSFLKGLGFAGAALSAGALLTTVAGAEERSGSLTRGDAAILRLLAAAEIIESDLWLQYAELGGIQDDELTTLATQFNGELHQVGEPSDLIGAGCFYCWAKFNGHSACLARTATA
jgi:hypothetical protein